MQFIFPAAGNFREESEGRRKRFKSLVFRSGFNWTFMIKHSPKEKNRAFARVVPPIHIPTQHTRQGHAVREV